MQGTMPLRGAHFRICHGPKSTGEKASPETDQPAGPVVPQHMLTEAIYSEAGKTHCHIGPVVSAHGQTVISSEA